MPRPKKGETIDEKTMKRLGNRIAMQVEIRKDDEITKIREWLKGNVKEISARQQMSYKQMRQANFFFWQGYTNQQILSALQKEFDIKENRALEIWRDSQKLYAEIQKMDKEFLRTWQIEDLREIIKLCKEEGNINGRTLAHKVLAGIRQEQDEQEKDMPEVTVPDFVILGSNQDELDAQIAAIPTVIIDDE